MFNITLLKYEYTQKCHYGYLFIVREASKRIVNFIRGLLSLMNNELHSSMLSSYNDPAMLVLIGHLFISF